MPKLLIVLGALFVLSGCQIQPVGKIEFPPYLCAPRDIQGQSFLLCYPGEVEEGSRT